MYVDNIENAKNSIENEENGGPWGFRNRFLYGHGGRGRGGNTNSLNL